MNAKKTKVKQSDATINEPQSSFFENDKFVFLLLGIAVLIVFIARMHLLSFPFERDEGEYAYFGKLILDCHAPYTLAYNMKLPGTYYMYAMIMAIFGESILGVHIGLTIISLASMILVFLISKNFASKLGAVIAATSFGVIGTSWTLLAQAAHATHFVIFYALLGTFVLLQLYKSKKYTLIRYFLSGVLFSLAFICKQSGLFFMFFGFTIILVKEFNVKNFSFIKNLALYLAGFVFPIISMLLYFYFFADFDKFWFWTVSYLLKYGDQIPLSSAYTMFKTSIGSITGNYTSAGYFALWLLSLLAIPFLYINKTTFQTKIIIISFFVFSFLTVVPGFYFRSHYFITLLPAMAILIATLFDTINTFAIEKLKVPGLAYLNLFIFIMFLGSGIKANADYLFKRKPEVSCKKIYGSNPFVESIKVAKFLEKNTTKDDKIAVLGSEPQICFYANRYSASGYIYTYNLVEIHSYALEMQKEMIKEIETSKPKYIVIVTVATSWLTRPDSERLIFNWADAYLAKNYKNVGILDIYPNKISQFVTGEKLVGYAPQSQEGIIVFERNQ